MKKKIYIFCKGSVSGTPPVYNLVLSLTMIGYSVELVCGEIAPETQNYIYSKSDDIKIINLNLQKYKSKFLKIFKYRKFVKQNYNFKTDDIIWYATFDTAISLYKTSLYKNNNFYVSVLELYDTAPKYVNFFLKRILNDAIKVIASEYNRAAIMRVKYKLGKTPFVLPNKPFENSLPPMTDAVKNKIIELKKFANNRKIILYQGMIMSERNLETLAKEISNYSEKYIFALIGYDYDYYQKLKSLNLDKNIIYLGEIAAPYHLHITKVSDIGILKYDYVDLNNIYCAPNKIWEYAAFNLILLANDIPGLRNFVKEFNAGCVIDFDEKDDLKKALENIYDNTHDYKKGAEKLYNSINLNELIIEIVTN